MAPEDQRIAIAKACGWQFVPDYCHGPDQPPEYTTITPDGRALCGHYPDYLNDLNAMHEAENSLTEEQRSQLSDELYDVAVEHQAATGKWRYLSLSAAQRAEAFLKTLDLWEP